MILILNLLIVLLYMRPLNFKLKNASLIKMPLLLKNGRKVIFIKHSLLTHEMLILLKIFLITYNKQAQN